MTGQMCWLPLGGDDNEKVLHLRKQPSHPWQPYQAFSQYAVPDHRVPGGSKGWATYQKLRQAGWALVTTAAAQTQVLTHK